MTELDPDIDAFADAFGDPHVRGTTQGINGYVRAAHRTQGGNVTLDSANTFLMNDAGADVPGHMEHLLRQPVHSDVPLPLHLQEHKPTHFFGARQVRAACTASYVWCLYIKSHARWALYIQGVPMMEPYRGGAERDRVRNRLGIVAHHFEAGKPS